MPRTSAQSPRQDPLHGAGLATVLNTRDFGCWEAAVAKILGQHRSELLSATNQFQAHFRVGRVGSYSVLHLQGRGRLRLNREQREHSVLWLPLRGITALAAGPLHQRILASARALAVAASLQLAGAEIAADQLTEVLREWTERQEQPLRRERITARRRRETVESARQWLATRLPERFSLQDLSRALAVSPRQLQYHFQQELGHSPMAEAKRLRLHRLRGLLLNRERDNCSVAELMVASGLIASGVTAGEYRLRFGESPRQTRNHRSHELP